MSNERKKAPRSWFLALFGLPFMTAGFGVLVMGPLDTLRLHVVSANWERVPARLQHVDVVSARDKDSTTYKVEARYQYEFGGRTYHGTRVGYETGTDSIRHEHDERANRLRRTMDRNEPVLAWVNPADPQQAFLVRELRWTRLLLMTVFGLVFGGVGSAMAIYGAWPVATAVPLTVREPIYSAERYGYWLWWGMGVLFLLMSLPALIALPKEVRSGNLAILLVLLFPLVGAWLLWLGIRHYRNWHHYGPLPVAMDPQPGQVGGDVGGRIQLRMPWRADNPYRVTLQCLHSKVSGSGKQRRRSESLLWQEEQVPYLQATAGGTELSFLFQPPAHLPETEPDGDAYHFWRLLLSGPSTPVALERTYTVPVQRGTGRSRLSIPAQYREQQAREARAHSLERVGQQIRVTQSHGGVQIHSPFGLHIGMKLVFLLFAAAFAGAAIFLTHEAQKQGGMLWLMAVVFSLFGYPMLVGAVFVVGRALKVEVRNGVLRSVRYWFGLPLWRRQLVLTRAEQLSLKSGTQASDGRRHQEYVHLIATDNGRKLRVAEDIAGREAAEALRDELIRLLGL